MNRFLVLLLSVLLLEGAAAAQEIDSAGSERQEKLEARLEVLIEETGFSMMKGLPGVYVWSPRLGNAEGVGGLFERDIQTDVELALRTAGIRVLTPDELKAHPATPAIYAEVVVDEDAGSVHYSIEIGLLQTVTLWNGESSAVTTWTTRERGTVGRSNLWQLRESVKSKVNEFANLWLKANPR